MHHSLFTYVKGVGLVLALFFVLYPGILIVQVLTDTVTESSGQILVLLGLSFLAWVWIIRLYRAYASVGLTMKSSE
jgi:membrane protein DedA with SNARE-associated domain